MRCNTVPEPNRFGQAAQAGMANNVPASAASVTQAAAQIMAQHALPASPVTGQNKVAPVAQMGTLISQNCAALAKTAGQGQVLGGLAPAKARRRPLHQP